MEPFEEPDGVEEDDEPLPAEPPLPGVELEPGLVGDDDAPPLDSSFFSMVLGGLDGVVVEPADDELDGEDGEVDDGVELVEDPVPLLLPPPRLQAVSMLAASAMETAIAMVDSLMWPPWLGSCG